MSRVDIVKCDACGHTDNEERFRFFTLVLERHFGGDGMKLDLCRDCGWKAQKAIKDALPKLKDDAGRGEDGG